MKKQKVSTLVVASSVSQTADKLKKQATPLFKKLESTKIVTQDDFEYEVEILSKLKVYRKEADVQLKGLIDPANTIIRNAKSLFKPFMDMVDAAEVTSKSKMVAFQEHKKLKASQVEQDMELGKISVSKAISKQSKLLDNSSEFASVREIQTLEIVDETKIPRQYLIPDEVAINKALKEGKKVPGCKMVTKTSIAIRRVHQL